LATDIANVGGEGAGYTSRGGRDPQAEAARILRLDNQLTASLERRSGKIKTRDTRRG